MSLARGDLIGHNDQDPRFLVINPISSGGKGHVYRGFDLYSLEHVAIKEFLSSKDSATSPEREALFTAQATHSDHDNPLVKGIPKFVDFIHRDEASFLVTQFATGISLENLITNVFKKLGGASPVNVLLNIIIQTGNIIDEAYKQTGDFHRDLKPGNIRITTDHQVNLTDWGLATKVYDIPYNRVMGTPVYITPEITEDHSVNTPQGHVFVLATILHQLLTGQLPYNYQPSDDFPAILLKVRNEPMPDLTQQPNLVNSIPAKTLNQLNFVQRKALAKEPNLRYSSLQLYTTMLQHILLTIAMPENLPTIPY